MGGVCEVAFYQNIKKNDFAGNFCFVKTEFFAAFRPGASWIMKVSTKNLSYVGLMPFYDLAPFQQELAVFSSKDWF